MYAISRSMPLLSGWASCDTLERENAYRSKAKGSMIGTLRADSHTTTAAVYITSRFCVFSYRSRAMQRRRRFQPMVDGLPYRIAPSSVAVVVPNAAAVIALSSAPMVTPDDTSMPEGGTPIPITLDPPGGEGTGTLLC